MQYMKTCCSFFLNFCMKLVTHISIYVKSASIWRTSQPPPPPYPPWETSRHIFDKNFSLKNFFSERINIHTFSVCLHWHLRFPFLPLLFHILFSLWPCGRKLICEDSIKLKRTSMRVFWITRPFCFLMICQKLNSPGEDCKTH